MITPFLVRQLDVKGNVVFDGDGIVGEPDWDAPGIPENVSRGLMPLEVLKRRSDDLFSHCKAVEHVRDVMMVEGYYKRPEQVIPDGVTDDEAIEAYFTKIRGFQLDFDRRRKSARQRVKKRRQREGI